LEKSGREERRYISGLEARMFKEWSTWRIIWVGYLAAAFLTIVILSIVFGTKDSPAERAAAAQKAKEEARWDTALGGAVTLRKMMRNPDSLKFSSALEMPDGSVCYQYRAQNGFGGMGSGSALVYKNHLVVEESTGFKEIYDAECTGQEGIDRTAEINWALKQVAQRE
jgi:hypothetical protein